MTSARRYTACVDCWQRIPTRNGRQKLRCDECRRTHRLEYRRKWQRENRGKVRQYSRAWNAANRERLLAYQKQYYAAERDDILAYQRKRRAALRTDGRA